MCLYVALRVYVCMREREKVMCLYVALHVYARATDSHAWTCARVHVFASKRVYRYACVSLYMCMCVCMHIICVCVGAIACALTCRLHGRAASTCLIDVGTSIQPAHASMWPWTGASTWALFRHSVCIWRGGGGAST